MKPPRLLLFILPLIAASASARTLHGSASAGKTGDGSSWGSPYKTLQEALMRVESGETILIAEGTYKANELRRGVCPIAI
jgi:hypothetical protein